MGMFWNTALEQRLREPEDIDDPALDTAQLQGALRGLERINLLSASAGMVWQPIRRLARELKTDRLRVLDIATGAGDVPLRLWHKARRSGLTLEIVGLDVSERAVEFATRRAETCGARIEFRKLDVFSESLPTGFDVVTCSLFLHHLDEATARQLLRRMAEAAERLVLVNDLRRQAWGMFLAHFAGNVLSRSPVVRVDAVRSVRAAFTLEEARALAAEAGLSGAIVSSRWPARYLLSWRRPATADLAASNR